MNSQIEYHGYLYSLLEPILTPAVKEKFAGDQITLKNILRRSRRVLAPFLGTIGTQETLGT